MPKQVSKGGGVMSRLGNKASRAKEAMNKEVRFDGGGGLPPGIKNGIGQVTSAEFKVYPAEHQNAGKDYFLITTVAKTPEEFVDDKGNKWSPPGTQFYITEPLYDTPDRKFKTVEEHIDECVNHMRKLMGADYDCSDLDAAAAGITELKPHTKYETWAGAKQELKSIAGGKVQVVQGGTVLGTYANEAAAKAAYKYVGRDPLTNYKLLGGCDAPDGESPSSMIPNDNTAGSGNSDTPAADSSEDDELLATAAKADKGDADATKAMDEAAAAAGVDPEEKKRNGDYVLPDWTAVANKIIELRAQGDEGGEATPPEGDADDLDALLEAANSDDEDTYTPAIERLTELAKEAGHDVDSEEFSALSWEEVVEKLKAGGDASQEAEPPKKGDHCQVLNKQKKKVKCKIDKVNKDGTVDLFNLATKKVEFKNVKVDNLIFE